MASFGNRELSEKENCDKIVSNETWRNAGMGLTDTPRANRLHIGIFGKRNSGKSSLTNALTG